MNEEPCIICEALALVSPLKDQPEGVDYRCENCGKYNYHNGLNESYYKELDGEQRERISNYIRAYNKATGKWAELDDLEELWKKIEKFNKERKEE